MTLQEQLNADVIESMKAKDSFRTKLLRNLQSKIKQVEVDTQKPVDESQILSVLQKQIKQRQESYQIFKDNARIDLADIEEKELNILESYLPKQMPQEQVKSLVLEVISDLKATSMKDMGKVMSIVKPMTAGKTDPSQLSVLVKEALSNG